MKPGQAGEDCCRAVFGSQGGRRGSVGGEGGEDWMRVASLQTEPMATVLISSFLCE